MVPVQTSPQSTPFHPPPETYHQPGGSDRQGEHGESRNGNGNDTAVVAPVTRRLLERTAAGTTVRVILLFEDQSDIAEISDRSASRQEVIRTLKEQTRERQAPARATLRALQATGAVQSYRTHWLVNAISVQATPTAIERLAQVSGVAAIIPDAKLRVDTNTQPSEQSHNASDPTVTVNLRNESERPTTSPAALNLSEELALPRSYRTRSDLVDALTEFPVGVRGSRAPEPVVGGRRRAVPAPASTPFDNDSLAWGVEKIHADGARAANLTGQGVRVAVIDTGVDDSHPDLDDRVVAWKDFVNGFDEPYDNNGHGTHVAGTIAGTGDAGNRTGVAPGADLMGVKVFGGSGGGFSSTVIAGIEWAIAHDADVVSMSLGGPHDQLFHVVVNRAANAGVIPVVAAGNFGGSREPFSIDLTNLLEVTDPGHVERAVTVGATHWQDYTAWFSAHDTISVNGSTFVKPDVAAPGVNVTSTRARDAVFGSGRYARLSGTSMATPHVSGVAALVLQEAPNTSATGFKRVLNQTARDLGPPGFDNRYGAGRVDASAAAIAAGSADELALDVTTMADGGDTVVTIEATLTDATGTPQAGENVTINVLFGPRQTLETHKADPGLYAFNGTKQTDANGTVTVTLRNPQRDIGTGLFTIEASANHGLTRAITEVRLTEDVNISVTPLNDTVLRNGDTAAFEIRATGAANGMPADATVTVVFQGPTHASLPGWTKRVRTGADGTATVTFPITENITVIHAGVPPGDPPFGGPSFGRYDVTTVVQKVGGLPAPPAVSVAEDVAEVRMEWTDLEFNQPETPLTAIQDLNTWQGETEIGARVSGRLETTQPATVYQIVLTDFDGNTTVIETVATDRNGEASFTEEIPATVPGGFYAVVAIERQHDVNKPGDLGEFDFGLVHVQAMTTEIAITSRQDPNDQATQPAENVQVEIVTRNASTGERVDPRTLDINLFDLHGVNLVQTDAGTFHANAIVDRERVPFVQVLVCGRDQNGGAIGVRRGDRCFDGHSEGVDGRHFTTVVQPDQDSYTPGENVTLAVRVADSKTGVPVERGRVNWSVFGLSASGAWSRRGTIKTNASGAGTITFELPSTALELPFAGSDVFVSVSLGKGSRGGFSVTGFDLLEKEEQPTITIQQVGAEQIGLFGLNDIATFKPGERLAFTIDANGFTPTTRGGRAQPVDVFAIKLSKVGDGDLIFDRNESTIDVVQFRRTGRATATYTMAENADAGFLIPIAVMRHNGILMVDSQLGVVGARPVNVTTSRRTVGAGGSITFTATGPLPRATDVNFIVKRKGSDGQFPLTSTGGTEPGFELILSQRNRTLARVTPLAERVVESLPEQVGGENEKTAIKRVLQDALVSAMKRSLAESAPGGALEVGEASVTPTSGGERTFSKRFRVPDNFPAGEYRVIAVVHSDDHQTVKEQFGFANFTVAGVAEGAPDRSSLIERFDENDDGAISLSELVGAATAFAQGDLNLQDLVKIATAFAQSS